MALDFSTLVPEDADVPKQSRSKQDNPFEAWLTESYENETGKKVIVPASEVNRVEYLLRRAADELGIGCRVVVQDAKGTTLSKADRKEIAPNTKITVLFQGKIRKGTTEEETEVEETE